MIVAKQPQKLSSHHIGFKLESLRKANIEKVISLIWSAQLQTLPDTHRCFCLSVQLMAVMHQFILLDQFFLCYVICDSISLLWLGRFASALVGFSCFFFCVRSLKTNGLLWLETRTKILKHWLYNCGAEQGTSAEHVQQLKIQHFTMC